jgi:hypothetical protein
MFEEMTDEKRPAMTSLVWLQSQIVKEMKRLIMTQLKERIVTVDLLLKPIETMSRVEMIREQRE